MVNKLKIVPNSCSLLALSDAEPTILFRADEPAGVFWRLHTRHSQTFILSVDYQNVVFKFECFGLLIEEEKAGPERIQPKGSPISEMYSLEFLFRSEWERPAKPNEVPEHYEQVHRSQGPFTSIEASATAACTSLVGMAWTSDRKSSTRQALFIDQDGDDPTALEHCHDQEKIASLLTSCDVVTSANLRTWEERINFWLKH